MMISYLLAPTNPPRDPKALSWTITAAGPKLTADMMEVNVNENGGAVVVLPAGHTNESVTAILRALIDDIADGRLGEPNVEAVRAHAGRLGTTLPPSDEEMDRQAKAHLAAQRRTREAFGHDKPRGDMA